MRNCCVNQCIYVYILYIVYVCTIIYNIYVYILYIVYVCTIIYNIYVYKIVQLWKVSTYVHAQNVGIRTLVVAITLLAQVVYIAYTTSFTYAPQHGIYKMALISIYYTNHGYFMYSVYMRRKLPLALVLGSYIYGIHCVTIIYRDGGGCLYPLY